MDNEDNYFEEHNEDKQNKSRNMEVFVDTNFSLAGCQVVRGEYFAHLFEPSITFNQNKIYLNTACIKRFPDIDYMQVLVDSKERKIAVRPCNEEKKDSIVWCSAKRKPKQISCKIFFGMIFDLMNWNYYYRYKLLGKLIKNDGEYLFLFDLKSYEMYKKEIPEGRDKPKYSRTPIFPEEWKNQFGLPVEEHKKQLQINLLDGYTVFGIKQKCSSDKPNEQGQNIVEEEHYE